MDEVAAATLILAFATFLLVIVTVLDTRSILRDNQKQRRLAWIDRRLSRLYYPLKNMLPGSGDDEMQFYVILTQEKGLSNSLYLAGRELSRILFEFMNGNPSKESYEQLKRLLSSELEALEAELRKLTSP